MTKFLKTLKKDSSPDLRRSLRAQSDSNVVQLLVRMGNEVAAVVGRENVIPWTRATVLAMTINEYWPLSPPTLQSAFES